MTAPGLDGQRILVVERDDLRAGRLVMALRGLGATAQRWTDDDKSRSAAVDVVLVDRDAAEGWAEEALSRIAAAPALAHASVVRTDAARLWSGDEPLVDALIEAIGSIERRADRDTKNLRAVATPPPSIEPPKVVVAPSIAARKIASARATEKYGAVAAPDVQPPAKAPPPEAPPKKQGFVFPARKATDVEDEGSSKATSLDLTAVPSSILERANLPDTDRFERATPTRSWVAWALGVALLLSVLAVVAAFVTR